MCEREGWFAVRTRETVQKVCEMEGRDGYKKPVLTTHSVLFIIADSDSQWCVRDGGWLVVGR